MEDKAKHAIEIIDQQLNELYQIIAQFSQDQDTTIVHERYKRWKTRTSELIARHIHPEEAKDFAEETSVIFSNFRNSLAYKTDKDRGFLQTLRETLEKYPDQVLRPPAPIEEIKAIAPPLATSRTVFIIHGHDKVNLSRLEELLKEKWELEPIVLASKAGKGRTIIEKFEQEAPRAGFAFALFTPDDFVAKENEEYGQPRPNAIFELGWFYGHLGRDRVCILLKEGTKMHSDLTGISVIEFAENVSDKALEIEQELSSAGLVDRQSA